MTMHDWVFLICVTTTSAWIAGLFCGGWIERRHLRRLDGQLRLQENRK